MADFVFPPTPTPDQQVTAPDGTIWQWNAASQRWVRLATISGQLWQSGPSNSVYYNAGDVGIGAAPSLNNHLEVIDTVGRSCFAAVHYGNDPNTSTMYFYKARGTQATPQDVQTDDWLMYLGWGGRLAGFTGSQGAIAAKAGADPRTTELVFYLNDGTDNVGSGYERLHFYAGASTGTFVKVDCPGTTVGGSYFGFYQNGAYVAEIGAWHHNGPGDGLSIDCGTMNGAIRILESNGYVGINIGAAAGPAYPLDVNGDLNVRGNIYRSGSILPVAGGAAISDTAPTTPSNGDLWFDSANLALCIRYQNAWVQVH